MLSSTRLRTTLLCLPVFLLCFRRPFPIQIRAQFTRGRPARQQPFWAASRFFSGFRFQVPSSKFQAFESQNLFLITYNLLLPGCGSPLRRRLRPNPASDVIPREAPWVPPAGDARHSTLDARVYNERMNFTPVRRTVPHQRPLPLRTALGACSVRPSTDDPSTNDLINHQLINSSTRHSSPGSPCLSKNAAQPS